VAVAPLWTPDGQRIIFMWTRAGVSGLYTQAADGTENFDQLTTSPNPQWPSSITSDGTRVVGFEIGPRKRLEVILFSMGTLPSRPGSDTFAVRSLRTEPLIQTLFDESFPELSPDGRYLAYQSNESRRWEIYVRPFPNVDRGRWQVSVGGGTRAAWARSGRELFYLDASNTLTAVPVALSGSTFSAGRPVKVFDDKYAESFPARQYDVSTDGQRFLMLKDSPPSNQHATPASMIVVLNWTEELKRLAPTR